MKKVLMSAVMVIVLMMSACGGKTNKSVGDTDSVQADSVDAEAVETSVDKHTEDYLRQRVDSFYSVYKNPRYKKDKTRIYNGKFVNRDSAYCTTSYYELLKKAEDLANENEELLIDYDHWTNSQDDNNFTCEVGKISQMTDSTAIVKIKAKNFGDPYTITLSMRFERNDWYVDDFISDDGTSEKAYLAKYIESNTFCQRFSLNDLLYLTEHYAEKAKAQKSGLKFVYYDSVQEEEMNDSEYVYGHDMTKSTKKGLGYELMAHTPHAFYFSMSLDTSTNGRLHFVNENDANGFYERASKTKPFTFEGKRIVLEKQPGGNSFLVQEMLKDKSTSTIFALHRPTFEDGYYMLYVEIYV